MQCITDFLVGNSLNLETLNKNQMIINTNNRLKILEFFKEHTPITYSGSYVKDIVTNIETNIPCRMYQEKNLFYWNDYHVYYFEHYSLKLNDDFIEYVLINYSKKAINNHI